jgi:hypothetical protein
MATTSAESAAYEVLVGIDYRSAKGGKPTRAEKGDVRDDLPEKSIPWLVKDGHIRPVKAKG